MNTCLTICVHWFLSPTCTSYAYNNAPVTSVMAFLLIFYSAGIPTGISYVRFRRRSMSADLSTQKPLNSFRYQRSCPLLSLSIPCLSFIFHWSVVVKSLPMELGHYGLKAMLCGMVGDTVKGYRVRLNKMRKRISSPGRFSVSSWSFLQIRLMGRGFSGLFHLITSLRMLV